MKNLPYLQAVNTFHHIEIENTCCSSPMHRLQAPQKPQQTWVSLVFSIFQWIHLLHTLHLKPRNPLSKPFFSKWRILTLSELGLQCGTTQPPVFWIYSSQSRYVPRMLCTQSNTCAFLYVHTLLPVSASSGTHVTNLLMLICMPLPWNEERLQIRIVCWSQVDPKIIEKRELVANSHTSTFALLLWRCPTKCHCISAGSCQVFPHSHPSFLEQEFLNLHHYGTHAHTELEGFAS